MIIKKFYNNTRIFLLY